MSTSKQADFFKMIFGFGCDPELFLFDTQKQQYIHGNGIIPGTKKEPFRLPNGGTVQLDGVACEIGITPSYSSTEWVDNLRNTLSDVKKLLPKNVVLRAEPAVWFDKEYFDKEVPDVCKELGCDPDFDAYKNGAPNPRPNGLIEKDGKILRTGAGHIHISWTDGMDVTNEKHRWNCILLTQTLDTLFTKASKQWDKDTTRAQMYGAPGCFRPKPYGMEYRVPSNAWLKDASSASMVYNITRLALYLTYVHGKKVDRIYDRYSGRYLDLTKGVDLPDYVYLGDTYEAIHLTLRGYKSGAMF